MANGDTRTPEFIMQQELLIEYTQAVHEFLIEVRDDMRTVILAYYDPLTITAQVVTINQLLDVWDQAYTQWTTRFQEQRHNAGVIAGNHLPRLHNSYLVPKAPQILSEQGPPTGLDAVDQLIRDMLAVTAEEVYPDDLNLSDRIWRLDNRTRETLRAMILEAGVKGTSAVELADDIVEFVGANDLCAEGADCSEKGITANAMRLARNELQVLHYGVTRAIYDRLPFVEGFRVHLSPSHPPIGCVCETIVGLQPDEGYRFGEADFPPYHVRCLCYVTSVLMPDDEFVTRMRGWLGGEEWIEMSEYTEWLGLTPETVFDPLPYNLEQALIQ